MDAKVLHDWLLKQKPEGANHEIDQCPYCTDKASRQEESVATFTEEQHLALLESAVEKAKAEATAEVDAEVLRLNEKLEAAEKELTARDEQIKDLESKISAREEQDRLEAIADERVELVKAVANFSDEQIKTRRLTWAGMDEDIFKSYLEDLRQVAVSPPPESKNGSLFDGTRETAGAKGTELASIQELFGVSKAS